MTEYLPEDIGALLKQRREQRGVSLEDAAQHTRIRKTHLESLESNQFSDLPGQVYVTGFIRVYANYLGLDSDPLLAQLEVVPVKSRQQSIKLVPVSKPQLRRSGKASAGKSWGVFALGLLAVALIVGSIYFLTVERPDRNTLVPTMNEVVREQETVPGPSVSTPHVEEQVSGEQPDAALLPSSQPTSDAVVAEEPAKHAPLPPVAPGGSSLRMLALAEGTLTIHVDDRKAHEYNLFNGLDLTWKINQKASIELARPGVARFWLGDQELDVFGLQSFQLQQAVGE